MMRGGEEMMRGGKEMMRGGGGTRGEMEEMRRRVGGGEGRKGGGARK